jgi:hypothetical protein
MTLAELKERIGVEERKVYSQILFMSRATQDTREACGIHNDEQMVKYIFDAICSCEYFNKELLRKWERNNPDSE